ncbi:MAG: molybdopterin molybdotransferase MoeA [Planctomycetota bacterium]|jgi:molybdopterin molybdotransferase
MIPPRQALHIVLEHARPLETTQVPLEKAFGCCLAEDVRADRDLPPADRSAMDGYAVRWADLGSPPCELRLVGEAAAGKPVDVTVRPRTCVRIFTGASVPPGADTVVMVEQTGEKNGTVTFLSGVQEGANIFRRAEDAREGETLLSRGTVLGPMQLGVCAAVGKAELKVHHSPEVSLLCTGEELRGVRAPVETHQMRNSNGPALCAALVAWGFADPGYRRLPDDLPALASQLKKAAAERDVVLLTGGVSKGKYDFVREAVERIGADIRFHGVAMKPGKPLLYATLPENKHVFGLPGNPLSAAVGFHEFVLPVLRRLSGVVADRCCPSVRVPLASPVSSTGGRVRFVLGRLLWGEDGPHAEPVKSKSSADLVAGGRADGAIVVPADARELGPGTMVDFRIWRPLP